MPPMDSHHQNPLSLFTHQLNSLLSHSLHSQSPASHPSTSPRKPHSSALNHTALISSHRNIQSLLLTLMCNIASTYFPKKSAGPAILDQIEQSRRCCFIDSAILICKLQHLNPNVPIKTQIELIVAMHYLLAEYGLFCAGGDGEIEEGTFLKLAIKHLLSLDMKLKSNFHSLNKGLETMQCDEQLSHNNHVETSLDKSKSDTVNVASDTVNVAIDKGYIVEKDVLEGVPSKGILSHESMEKRIQDWNVANAVVMGPTVCPMEKKQAINLMILAVN